MNIKSFTNLEDAIDEISTAIENDTLTTLSSFCIEELPKEWILERLKEKHTTASLRQLYAQIEFPKNEHEFKLGGHDKELGHIHIDFVKNDGSWFLNKIWMCR